MRVTFIGLSCFLIENNAGFRVLVDPFNGTPEWTLGPKFPVEFNGKPFGANIVLMSEPDADHAYAPGGWLQAAPSTSPNTEPFPGLDLRGTVVQEFNGDLNVAWHYTIDGIRLAHFGDCSHVLTEKQLAEIGHPDVVFMAAPKVNAEQAPQSLDIIRKNIALVSPKIVIWAHHVAPAGMPDVRDVPSLRAFFLDYFAKNTTTNKTYDGPESFMSLCYCLENAFAISKDFAPRMPDGTSIDIDGPSLSETKKVPDAVLFTTMLAESRF